MSAVEIADELAGSTSSDEGQLIKGLTWSQRVQGYALCLALGLFASFMSWVALGMGHYWKYSVLSTIGSLTSLLGTAILMGPATQLRYMMDEYRRSATFCYLGSLVVSLIVAIATRSFFWCMVCGIVQYAALGWYSLSYVPYGRETVLMFLCRSQQ